MGRILMIKKKLILLIVCLLMFGLFSPARVDAEVNVAMILWRGETQAEVGFINGLIRAKGSGINFSTFDAKQDKKELNSIIDGLDRSKYDLIYTFGTTASKAVKKKIDDVPIVFNVVSRPVESGIIKSWESSGNNMTGVSGMAPMDSIFKTLSLIMHIRKLGFVYNAKESNSIFQKREIEKIQGQYGFILMDSPIESVEKIEETLIKLIDAKVDAVMFPSDSMVISNADKLVSVLNRHKIPTIAAVPQVVNENGALLSLGADYYKLGILAAENALLILEGKKPADIPSRTVDNLKLTANYKTAQKLGITFPIQLIKNVEEDKAAVVAAGFKPEGYLHSFFSEGTFAVIRAVIPSFTIVFIGFLLGKAGKGLHQKTISNLIYYIFSPCLIFSSLHKRVFDMREFGIIAGSVVLLIVVMIPFAYSLKKMGRIKENGYYLPVIFMSTGTISLPIALLLYGNEGLSKAILFHMVNIVLLYSFGVFLVRGKFELKQILKIPSLHASILGVLVATAPVNVSVDTREFLWLIEKGVDLIGVGTIPLLIISFGYSLNNTNFSDLKDGVSGGALRILMGPLFAFAIIYSFRYFGWMSMEKGYDLLGYLDLRTTEAIIVLNAAMPGPIMAYMLNVKFDSCPEKAATMLFIGSVGGLLTIPIVLHLINLFIFR
jgi:ABC-type uncharacterized transport system substrate-binding protein/predicted permease